MRRKTVDGDIRNKERTEEKLIDAVGEILLNEGHSKLGVNKIAKIAGVDKKLIYRYFGGLNGLVNAYCRKRDFWGRLSTLIPADLQIETVAQKKAMSEGLLMGLFKHLGDMKEAQKIILWEVSEKNEAIKQLCEEREALGSDLFKLSDELFAPSGIDFRAWYAVMLGGVYYLTLHANATGGGFCEIDIKQEEGQQRIERALKQMIQYCFDRTSE